LLGMKPSGLAGDSLNDYFRLFIYKNAHLNLTP